MPDFRDFVAQLDADGQLVRFSKEVDPQFELGALIWKLEEQGKAAFFENVKGSNIPVVAGVMNGLERYARLHGIDDSKHFTRRDHAKIMQEAIAHSIPPRELNTGPVKDVIKLDDAACLYDLPVPTFCEDDSGAFITAAIGVSRHLDTSELNVGVYRALVVDQHTLNINISPTSNLRGILHASKEKGEPLPLSLAIGNDPLMLMAAAGKPESDTSEYAVAGALRKDALELVRCETNDLLVPAHAEIVIEGVIDFTEERTQQFGEFAGQYGPGTNPNFRVTAITHRKDPLFHAIFGEQGREHFTLGSMSLYGLRDKISQDIKAQFPLVTNAHMIMEPSTTGPMFQLNVQMRKSDNDQPKELIPQIFGAMAAGLPMSSIFKRIVVVDEDIDFTSYKDVEWAIWSRVADASKVIIIPDQVSWDTERGTKDGKSVRIGFDATMDLEDRDSLKRPIIPGLDDIELEDYL